MLAVWLAVTASAVTVAWFGIDSVVGAQALSFPQLLTPVDPSGADGSVLAGGATAQPLPATPLTPVRTSAPAPSPTADPPKAPPNDPVARLPVPPPPTATTSVSGQVRRFSMIGGVVVAQFDGDTVNFVSASPASGYQMTDWIEAGQEWLRVDFTKSADNDIVYSLFITWNGYSPQWTEAGPDGTQNGS